MALAISGGPDSMAMLALAAAAFPGRIAAATVDHRLRPAAADEAAMAADWCARHDVRHATLVAHEDLRGSGVQARARTARYALLAGWVREIGACCLATAHHADDQAETFLMRAVRGSGPAGLAGIRRRREHDVMEPLGDGLLRESTVVVVRPLLDWSRRELRRIVIDAAMPFVDDPSNRDEQYERVRVRRLLAEQPWLDAAQLARAAAHVGEAHAALEAMCDWLWRERRAVPDDDPRRPCEVRLDMAGLPRELKRRLARDAIALVRAEGGGAGGIGADQVGSIEPLLDAVEAGRAATQGEVLVSRSGDLWHFREAPPRRSP